MAQTETTELSDSPTASIMQAWTFTTRGLPTKDRLKLSPVPRPTAKDLRPDAVLIKVQYVGIWPRYSHTLMPTFPHLTSSPWFPEMDFSGTIEALGSSVGGSSSHPASNSSSSGDEVEKKLKVGDEVFGTQDPATHLRYGGVAREYICLPAKLVVKKPEAKNFDIDMKALAALGGNACAAAQFMDVLKVEKGQKVLVTGASGALGTMLIPILRATLGEQGTIVGVCSGTKADMIRQLGANKVIDYQTTPDLSIHLQDTYSSSPFDIVIDITGHDDKLYAKCSTYLDVKGTYLYAGNISSDFLPHPPGLLTIIFAMLKIQIKIKTPVFLGGVPRRTLFHPAQIDQACLQSVRKFVIDGVLVPKVEKVWDFNQLLDLYEHLKGDRGWGKHLLRVA